VSLNHLLAVVVAGAACVIPALQTRADTIFVDCPLEGTIHEFTTNGVGSIFTRQSIANPQGEAFDQAGNLYIANEGFNTIEKFSPNGVASLVVADPGDFSILDSPEGLAFDRRATSMWQTTRVIPLKKSVPMGFRPFSPPTMAAVPS
jgi:hypothetical protein